MNDLTIHGRSSDAPIPGEAHSSDETVPDEAVPRFGVLDIVEAFTAMRHEWRGQTKETRLLADQIQQAVTNIEALESRLLASATDVGSDESSEVKQLVQHIVETDHQLSRAIAAISQSEAIRRRRDAADDAAVQRHFAGMNAVARWFARPLLSFITEQRTVQRQMTENASIEGLNLVLARLRRAMTEHAIERLDAEGQPFDADTMRAIGTVESTDCAAGHVVDQISPAYRWQGRLLRYADVRVAK